MSRSLPTTPDDVSRLPWGRRLLSLVTEVRAGEAAGALALAVTVLLLLCAYYLVKPLREGWLAVTVVGGLSRMEVKAYSGFAQSLVLLVLMMGYGRLAVGLSRQRLILGTLAFNIGCMLLFWALQPGLFIAGLPGTGVVFYLWVGIFGVFVLAQFWAFAADLYEHEQGKRLIPLVALGATLGAVLGSWLSSLLSWGQWIPQGHQLLLAVVPVLAAMWLVRWVILRGPQPPPPAPRAVEIVGPEEIPASPLRLVLGDPLLLALAVVTLLLNWVNTNGENILFRVVQEVLTAEAQALPAGFEEGQRSAYVLQETTRFYGTFFFWVNGLALVLQGFVVSRLVRLGGFGAVFMALPFVALVAYSAMSTVASLAVIRILKVAENATDYSVSNTARHIFWLPIQREVTFQAKPAIDSLFARLGDGLAAVTVLVGVHVVALSTRGFIGVNIALLVVWVALGAWIVARHRLIVPRKAADARA